jgi:hypothetical protein
MPANRPNRLGLSRAGRAALVALALLIGATGVTVLPGSALAQDKRPSELPYDQPGDIPSLDPSYRQRSHKVVLITDQALNPRLTTLEEGQLVAWISYSKVPSEIVFEREVARNMVCHSLVNFSIVDDEIRSSPIHPGEFASFCELKPGRYRYKVVRTDPKASGQQAARSRLEGEIIVGNPN